MNRNELKELSRIRLEEARALLKNGKYDGAYYLCGYAVECALKACIAKQTKQYDFPDKKTVNDSYTHDLTKLTRTAQLPLEQELESNEDFATNWSVVKEWSEESRYERFGEKTVHDLYSAVTDIKHGVLQWIRQHW